MDKLLIFAAAFALLLSVSLVMQRGDNHDHD